MCGFWTTVSKTVRPMLSDRCTVCLSGCDVGVFWPNGWMDQDAIWYGGRPRPRPHCVRWGPSRPERGTAAPTFLPMSFVANGWMDQDATWPRRHCVRWGPNGKGTEAPAFRPIFLLWPNGRPSQLLLSSCWDMLAECGQIDTDWCKETLIAILESWNSCQGRSKKINFSAIQQHETYAWRLLACTTALLSNYL